MDVTPILGAAQCSAEQARRWAIIKGAPSWYADLASSYWEQAPRLGVRADVAYAQGCKETNFGRFGGVIDASYCNPCGLKTAAGGGNYDPDAHTRFPDWATGIRAHLEHLHLYAKGPVSDPVDPRHFPSIAATAPTVEALSGRWAPSSTYHESILRYVEEMSAMSGFLDWLPGVLRAAGVDVYVMPGAERRTSRSDGLTVSGIVWHHTATGPTWYDGHVAALLRDGRRDLAGPLAQVGIERDGTWVIVALGRANHNGYGTWGNDSIGLEFYNDGIGEAWPHAQVESGIVGTAAILAHEGKTASAHCRGHRETDPRRKIDPAGLSMYTIRQRVAAALTAPVGFPSQEEDEDMYPTLLTRLWHEKYGPTLSAVQERGLQRAIVEIELKPTPDAKWNGYRWYRETKFGLVPLS